MTHVLPALIAGLIFLTMWLPNHVVAATLAPVNSVLAATATHVVAPGDTLYSIARRYGTTVDALKAANGLTSNIIWIGQTLQVGSSSPQPSPPPFGGTYHTVVRGDTLYSLARRYGTTVDAIMRANGLISPTIYIGQRLLIASSPVPPTTGTTYTVVRGDTLYSIARRYGTTVDALKAANNISGNFIYIGQVLLIPQGATIPTATPLPTRTTTPAATQTPVATTTAQPTATASPTPITTLTPMSVIIQSINFDGVVPGVESDEYAVITNVGSTSQNIGGWRLHADDRGQDFFFPSIDLAPGQTCRVYTNEVHPGFCGFSFEDSSAIWNNTEGDCGRLYSASGALVSTFCYDVES